jgi:hypothetical protein
MNIFKRRWIGIGVVVLVIFLASYIVGYVFCISHVSFDVASKYIARSSALNNEIGPVRSIRLEFFGYELEFTDDAGTATYEIIVKGVECVALVTVEVQKSGEEWHVGRTAIKNVNCAVPPG